MSEHVRVVVVGAGPAGLAVALLLHRAGVGCVVLERHSRDDMLSRVAKAGSIDFRTVELLKSVGLSPEPLSFDVRNGRCEFRTPAERVVFDYGDITGGRPHFILPQHELVGRLLDALLTVGGDVRFSMPVVNVERQPRGAVVSTAAGLIVCEALVGADGVRSVVASALPGVTVVEETMPVRLLAVLGETPPLEQHTIYAGHPRGFAGQMRRSPAITRFYLEVPATDELADWPADRIRDELAIRLLVPGRLDGVAFIEPSFVDLRMRMTSPMQDGCVYLAGDAAHLVTPAGGKGMNLAIADAVELALGLIEQFGPTGNGDRLARYSDTRLPVIWQTQAFSRWMLHMMIAGAGGPGAAFGAGLKQGWVRALQHDPLLARWFAHTYAGVDPPVSPL